MTKQIVVIGMGYVGIPCAALLADVPGFNVAGVQRRSKRSGWKIECLNAGRSPFKGEEPGLAELIRRVALEKKTFRVTDDYTVCGQADVILIDVQTPTDANHEPRYESLREVTAQIGVHLQPGTLVITESTVAPGTIQHVVQPILERKSGLRAGENFHLAFSYERVTPGKLLDYIVNFPRVVGGVDEESTRRAVELYRHIVKHEVTATDVLTAEIAKTVENAYRDVNIAFANEVALACEQMGVDVYEIRQMINARPDRYMHTPGAGVGGHCLPKDSWLLKYGIEKYGKAVDEKSSVLKLIPLAREINDWMPVHMLQLIEEALTEAGVTLREAKVVLLGVAYLQDTDDTRNTPAAALANLLQARGAQVVAHDPYVRQEDWQQALDSEGIGGEVASDRGAYVPLTDHLWEALQEGDCAVLVTRHREYCDLDLERATQVMRTLTLVDGRNVFDQRHCVEAGFVYRAVGKGRQ